MARLGCVGLISAPGVKELEDTEGTEARGAGEKGGRAGNYGKKPDWSVTEWGLISGYVPCLRWHAGRYGAMHNTKLG